MSDRTPADAETPELLVLTDQVVAEAEQVGVRVAALAEALEDIAGRLAADPARFPEPAPAPHGPLAPVPGGPRLD